MSIAMSLGDVLEIVTIVGSIFAVLVGGLVTYFLVRPSRRNRAARPSESDALDPAEVLAFMDRMERRLETLERLVTEDEAPPRIAPREIDRVSKAVEGREAGRTR